MFPKGQFGLSPLPFSLRISTVLAGRQGQRNWLSENPQPGRRVARLCVLSTLPSNFIKPAHPAVPQSDRSDRRSCTPPTLVPTRSRFKPQQCHTDDGLHRV
jgi:hypothetical protein